MSNSNSLCKTSVAKTYQSVISDVIENVRDHFMEDGVDETVLQELKQLWKSKLAATKAVEEIKEVDKSAPTNSKSTKQQQHFKNPPKPAALSNPHLSQFVQNDLMQQQLHQKQEQLIVGEVPPNNHIPANLGHMSTLRHGTDFRWLSIQLTIPIAPDIVDENRILSINVPEVFLQGQHLKTILTGTIIGTTMGLPLESACAFLQRHVNNAYFMYQYESHPPYQPPNPLNLNFNMGINNVNPRLLGGPSQGLSSAGPSRVFNIPQNDGLADTSDEDEDKSEEDDDNEIEDDKDDAAAEEGAAAAEEEPLNSGDDVSDADGTEESFETDNVIVCQYDKITRSRNKWKFHFKDGIMNLHGEDFVFQKANGDAEW